MVNIFPKTIWIQFQFGYCLLKWAKILLFSFVQVNQFAVALTLPINVVDSVCSVNVVVAVNAPTVKRPVAKAARAAKEKKVVKMATNNHANDANSVLAVKAVQAVQVAKVAASMDHADSVTARVDHVAMKMEKSLMAMAATVLARPVKVLVKVREAKMDARNASSDAISVDHHADHVAADHHAIAREMMATPKVATQAKMAKDRKDNEELDVTIETAHQNKAAPIK